ncbi:unnamed protein product [Tetraodon nigroviridis]|nr:unnamed protein product [Tetraodon nigroviridis]
MCAANFLCFICGVAVLGLGIYLLISFKIAALTPSLAKFNIASILVVVGIVITCVSFLGFMGALKENRCLLLTFFLLLFFMLLLELTAACYLLLYQNQVGEMLKKELRDGLEKAKAQNRSSPDVFYEWDLLQNNLRCCGLNNRTDWGSIVPHSCCLKDCNTTTPEYKKEGCLTVMMNLFEDNFLTTGVCVIVVCIIEVLAMCFAMTLFCHIRTGLGYKL